MPTRSQLFELAHSLGHQNPQVFEKGNGWFVSTCSCGYRSTNRRTLRLALEAGIHHALTEAEAGLRANSGRRIDELLAARAG